MKCKKCKSEISEFDIFCKKCGTETDLLSKGLSSKYNKKKTAEELKPIRNNYYSLSMFLTITIIFPILILLFLSKNNHLIISLTAIIFIPFILILITRKGGFLQKDKKFTIKEYLGLLSNYPKFMIFVIYNVLYFYILTFVCTAKPLLNYAYDPILNLVWLVMFFYWFAVIVPAPGLIAHKNYSPFKAVVASYIKGKETRWQQFFTFFHIVIDILFGIVTFGFGFMTSIPHIILLLDNYFYQMDKYRMFE